ncbi:hypothetical protein [Dinoroseobacter sp. S124A]|uniref:hypothetical protein n=1 Tax=Dinoroseobacter sp. S124A TaxID=3415128 RepID=UPI003C7A2219
MRRAMQSCKEATTTHKGLKRFFCRSVPYLSGLMFLSLFCLMVLSLVFWIIFPSGGLFVVTAQTSRLDYEVTSAERSEIAVQGALVQVGSDWVVDAAQLETVTDEVPAIADHAAAYCYRGVIRPGPATRVELSFEGGEQVLRIDAVQPDAERIESYGTLSYNDRDLMLNADRLAQLDAGGPAADPLAALLLDPLSEGEDLASDGLQPQRVGEFPLTAPFTLVSDPACAELIREDMGEGSGAAFATRSAPMTIDGPAVIGRKLRQVSGLIVVDDDIPHLSGQVEVIIRQALCVELIATIWETGFAEYDKACRRIYRVEAEPIALPPGSALTGVVTPWSEPEAPSQFYGQVSFEDGRYTVDVATEADSFKVLRPGAGGRLQDSNIVSVPFIDRVLLEPWLILCASLFFTFSGLVFGILQIEDED